MPSRYSRFTTSRARLRAMWRKRFMIGGGALVAIIALALLLWPKGGRDAAVEAVAPTETEATEVQAVEEATPEPTPTPEPTAEPTPTPIPASSMRALSRPEPTQAGFLPVFSKANTEEKIIAITVDDCFQAENLRQIVDKAQEYDARLTIFPIGKNAVKAQQKEILKEAWEKGFEIENHTLTHSGLFNISNEELAQQVYLQQVAVSYVLGVDYHCHFLRPRGGDARGDQRMHAYARQMGYYGIAHWSVDGKFDDSVLGKGLKPGAIYLFHTTDKDLDKLLRFIPWVAEKGYQMVTLNEMFDYPANEYSELAEPIDLTLPLESYNIPPLEPYEMTYVRLKADTYSWEAWLVQEKLIALGYLTGEPDGVYGKGCAEAVKAYQRDHGMEETGIAEPELVRELLEGTGK